MPALDIEDWRLNKNYHRDCLDDCCDCLKYCHSVCSNCLDSDCSVCSSIIDLITELFSSGCHIFISFTLYFSIDQTIIDCCNIRDKEKDLFLISAVVSIIFHCLSVFAKLDCSDSKICRNTIDGFSSIFTSVLIYIFYVKYDLSIVTKHAFVLSLIISSFNILKIFYKFAKSCSEESEARFPLLLKLAGYCFLIVIAVKASKPADHNPLLTFSTDSNSNTWISHFIVISPFSGRPDKDNCPKIHQVVSSDKYMVFNCTHNLCFTGISAKCFYSPIDSVPID